MKWQVEETVGEFGRHIGIESLGLSEKDSLTLRIEQIGALGIELVGDQEEHVAVSLARVYQEPFSEAASRHALEGCHYRVSRPFPVHVAFSATGNLAFAVCLETRNFTIQSLHAIVDELDQMHEAMKSVATLDS